MKESKRNVTGLLQSIVGMKPVIILFLLLLLSISFIMIIGRCGEAAEKAMPDLKGIAENFSKGHITQTFISSLPEITSTKGDILETAHYDATEIFSRRDSRSVFWGALPLGENVVEIRVPATYRYHIKLSDAWQLDVTNNTCIVYAPVIRPSQPPYIHTDRMEKMVIKQGWARFDARETLDKLEKGITPELSKRAESVSYLNMVREASRESVASFVRNWLLRNDQWADDKFTTVIVIFPDERQGWENKEFDIKPFPG